MTQQDTYYNPDHYEQSLIQPGHFGVSRDNIIIIENFIEKDDLKKIQNFLPTINEWIDPGGDQYSSTGEVLYNASY